MLPCNKAPLHNWALAPLLNRKTNPTSSGPQNHISLSLSLSLCLSPMAASSLSNFFSSLSLNSPPAPALPRHPKPSFLNLSLSLPPPSLVGETDAASVVQPAVAHANVMFFKSSYNVQVIVDEYEDEEKLINRFRKKVLTAGVIQECKRRMYFEDPRQKAKRKAREVAKRKRRPRRRKSKNSDQDMQVPNRNKGYEEDGDNWELSDDNLPAHEYLLRLSQTNKRWHNDERTTRSIHSDTSTLPLVHSLGKKKGKWNK